MFGIFEILFVELDLPRPPVHFALVPRLQIVVPRPQLSQFVLVCGAQFGNLTALRLGLTLQLNNNTTSRLSELITYPTQFFSAKINLN